MTRRWASAEIELNTSMANTTSKEAAGKGRAGAVGLSHGTGRQTEAEDPEVDADAPEG